MNDKRKIHSVIFWIYVAFVFTSCLTYYKTVTVPADRITLNEYLSKKQIWTIEDANHRLNRINNVRIHKDSISGDLSPMAYRDHADDKEVFRKNGAQAKTYLHLQTNRPELSEPVKIPLSDITGATVHEDAKGKTILVNSAIAVAVAGTVVTATLLTLETVCNCPYVEVIGADTTTFQGSLFPGAISKSLERSDNLILKGVKPDKNGQITLRIENELPEREYIDQIELYEVDGASNSLLGLNSLGEIVSFNAEMNLLHAETPFDRDITNELSSSDGGFYDFSEYGSDTELNKIFLTFRRDQIKDRALLIVRAKQSKWLEKVAEFFFQQLGTRFSDWVDRLDKVDPLQYEKNAFARGMTLNAYVKRNNQWDYLGSCRNAGTAAFRTFALNLDLDSVSGDIIEVKLEAGHGFWDLDYVGVTDEWRDSLDITRLKTIYAVNQAQANVIGLLETDDEAFVEQPAKGTFIEMTFEAPSNPDAYLILRGNGYYHHTRDFTQKPNYKALAEIKENKRSFHLMSRLLQEKDDALVTK